MRLRVIFPALPKFEMWIRFGKRSTQPREDNWVADLWLIISTLLGLAERNANLIPSFCQLPVSFRILVDRCGSLGSTKKQIYYSFLLRDDITFGSMQYFIPLFVISLYSKNISKLLIIPIILGYYMSYFTMRVTISYGFHNYFQCRSLKVEMLSYILTSNVISTLSHFLEHQHKPRSGF